MSLKPRTKKPLPESTTKEKRLHVPRPLRTEATFLASSQNRAHIFFVLAKASELYKALRKQGMTNGYSSSVVAKASIYTAHRLCGIPMNLSEFPTTTAREKTKITRCHKQICLNLGLDLPRLRHKDYLTYVAAKATISKEVETLAWQVLRWAEKRNLLGGANPFGNVATALYIAARKAGQRVTQKRIAEAAGVSEITVRTVFKKLRSIDI